MEVIDAGSGSTDGQIPGERIGSLDVAVADVLAPTFTEEEEQTVARNERGFPEGRAILTVNGDQVIVRKRA